MHPGRIGLAHSNFEPHHVLVVDGMAPDDDFGVRYVHR